MVSKSGYSYMVEVNMSSVIDQLNELVYIVGPPTVEPSNTKACGCSANEKCDHYHTPNGDSYVAYWWEQKAKGQTKWEAILNRLV